METLEKKLLQLGNKLVTCNLKCVGINNNPKKGIIPRCLYFERLGRNEENGCVIVGINPGRGTNNDNERQCYLQNQITYNTIINFWNNQGKNHLYYKYLRDFVDCVGYNGPILWTELVKCENNTNIDFPPLQTFRTCTHKYLTNELNLVPDTWPIIAVGREAHKALSYLYPTKSVLGVPHPTSSRGNFAKLFFDKNRKKFKKNVQKSIDEFLKSNGIELWLTA